MKQLSKKSAIFNHLYPGVLITLGFVIFGPLFIRCGYPPQFGMLVSVVVVALPLLIIHLYRVKQFEHQASILAVNGFNNKLPFGKLAIYSMLLVVTAFVVWGITQPADNWVSNHLFYWLPKWYTLQNFSGYAREKVRLTLILNLFLNGILAPIIEEFYFRGYLLPRMDAWGKYAFVVNAVLFSLYHFWQPYVYITLILALLPMTWLVSKTKDIRLGILTHSLMNLVGALLSFGLLNK